MVSNLTVVTVEMVVFSAVHENKDCLIQKFLNPIVHGLDYQWFSVSQFSNTPSFEPTLLTTTAYIGDLYFCSTIYFLVVDNVLAYHAFKHIVLFLNYIYGRTCELGETDMAST